MTVSRQSTRAGASVVACLLLAVVATIGPASAAPLTPKVERNRTPSGKINDLKAQGDKAQRLAETRQRLWDRKMKAVSGSICIGC